MNVLGKNERSWRKARKRGVSPIIATILLVAITVVLAAVLYVLISGLSSGGVGSKPIGSAFSAGNPTTASKCGAGTYLLNGCLTNDYVYVLTVETTGATFGNVLFEVKTTSGSIYAGGGVGGFTVLTVSGGIAAQGPTAANAAIAMTSTFSTFGGVICNGAQCGPSTPWSSIYTIMIDTGTANPSGLGLTFVAIGTAGYSGTTSPLGLP